MKKYEILSPDGFTIDCNTYKTIKEAKIAFDEWLKNYERQGYYSSVNYGLIQLNDVETYCTLIQK